MFIVPHLFVGQFYLTETGFGIFGPANVWGCIFMEHYEKIANNLSVRAESTKGLITPEIAALGALAACFANIGRGLQGVSLLTSTSAQIPVTPGVIDEAVPTQCPEPGAVNANVSNGIKNLIKAQSQVQSQVQPQVQSQVQRNAEAQMRMPGGAAAQLNRLRQAFILRFDYFWDMMHNNTSAQPLKSLCALSDYYAATLGGYQPKSAVDSGSDGNGLQFTEFEIQQMLSDIMLNGSQTITDYMGYPAVEDSVLWERWDSEPAAAFKWFKLYLRMQDRFGFRSFAFFQEYLQCGLSKVLTKATSGIYSRIPDAFASMGAYDDELENAELGSELGIKRTALVDGILNPSSVINRQELLKIRAYYHLFYWDLRCSQYDLWEKALLYRRGQRRANLLLDSQFTDLTELYEKVRARVCETTELMSPNDAMRALQDIAKMLRVTVGYYGDKPGRPAPVSSVPQQYGEPDRDLAVGEEVSNNEALDALLSNPESSKLFAELHIKAVAGGLAALSEN